MRAAALLCLVLAGCDAGPDSFTERCHAVVGVGNIAQHDFGTTDPVTLSRVVVMVNEIKAPGVTLTSGRPEFNGSVGTVFCSEPTEIAIFILEAP